MMKSNRREFLASLAAFPSASILDSLEPLEINPPLQSLQPVDSENHTVQYNYDKTAYEVSVSWLPYKISGQLTLTISLPVNQIEASFDKTLRNPFDMYTNLSQTETPDEFITGIEQSLSTIAFTNFISGHSPKPSDYHETKKSRQKSQKSQIKQKRKGRGSQSNSDIEVGLSRGESELNGQTETNWKSFIIPQIVRFVQRIKYKEDYKRDIPIDYPQFPIETMYFGVGDCEDTALLLGSILENLSTIQPVRTALVVLPGHMTILAAIPDLPNSKYYDTYTMIDGTPYTYFETTSPTTIYGTPTSRQEPPLFIYQNESFKNINIGVLPASVRESSRIGKKSIMSLLSNYI